MAIPGLELQTEIHFPRSAVHVGLRGDISRRLGTGRQYDDSPEGTVHTRDHGEERHSRLRVRQ